jgi:hypothetical protein
MRFSEVFDPETGNWNISRVTKRGKDSFVVKSWVSVKKSNIKGAGKGVFANRDFCKGACIGFYVGVARLTKEECTYGGNYTMEVLDGAAYIDGGECGNWTSFVNDGLKETNNVRFSNQGKFTTKRAIKQGEELLTSYGPTYWKT